MKFLVFCIFSISLQVFAQGSSFGKELNISTKNDGGYNLGVHYSYDSDITGSGFQMSWSILFGTDISREELAALPADVKWNLYSTKSKTFIFDWKLQPTVNKNQIFMGTVSVEKKEAKVVIGNQVDLILVFANPSGAPLFQLNVGKLCSTLPTYFNNLTEPQKRCSQVSVRDIDLAMKKFCSEKESEFLGYVKEGLLKCEIVAKKYDSLGCGVLNCK